MGKSISFRILTECLANRNSSLLRQIRCFFDFFYRSTIKFQSKSISCYTYLQQERAITEFVADPLLYHIRPRHVLIDISSSQLWIGYFGIEKVMYNQAFW